MNPILYTENSRLSDVLKNPIGHDIIAKVLLQNGASMKMLRNPIIGMVKLKSLPGLSKGLVDVDFVRTFVDLLNTEPDRPLQPLQPIQKKWWKEAVVYQIYPRSFKDSNGDGIGDLNGITEKLDYLKDLGVDILWLSPVYDSPNDDNGYDIRDYRAIMHEFGTMQDFDRLLTETHARGMRLIMDLVINHTSDEHEWFQKALSDSSSPYRDYYFFQRSENKDTPPNNWTSFFSGSAWNYYAEQDIWALHLFSKKQMDLNWENDALRSEVYDMINWWLEKGIDGFRLDVINYISKRAGLPQGSELIGKMMGFTGVEHYFYGPNLNRYLKEMHERTFGKYNAVTVGETPGVGMQMSKLLTGEERGELDMAFNFDHLENPGKQRFDDYRYDLTFLKELYTDWQLHYGNNCWQTLFYENHDNPRMVSKVNPEPQYRERIAKLLAVILCTLKGTPYLFQGQELGMVNMDFKDESELRDVESINLLHDLLQKMDKKQALKVINSGSRDHARTPMQWSAAEYAGFSSVQPWIGVNPNYKDINADAEQNDQNSVLNFYKRMIAMRKSAPALIYGEFVPVGRKRELFTYYRTLDGERYYIEINLTDQNQNRSVKANKCKALLSNYSTADTILRPYEAAVYRCE